MINRKKYILKRKYISPMLVVEETEPWELMAGSPGEFEEGGIPSEGDNGPFAAKSNSFFEQYPDIFEDTTEE